MICPKFQIMRDKKLSRRSRQQTNSRSKTKGALDQNISEKHAQNILRNCKTRDRPYGRGWAQAVDKQKLETNYYDPVYENCHISAFKAPRHHIIGRERAYTIVHHKMGLFLSRSSYVSN